MNKQAKYIIITVVLVLAAAVIVIAIKTQLDIINGNAKSSQSAPQNLEEEYSRLYGDTFDEQYIAGMLAHHEGAVNMSEQALAKTERPEIRQLSLDIIESQSAEILKMREWQQKWRYEQTYSGGHGSHGGGGSEMAGHMVAMQDALNDKSGKAYEKEFLKQMIIHHQQAVEMSRPAEKNAAHHEIKSLAKDIISAQQKEIDMMKQWQVEWGFASEQN